MSNHPLARTFAAALAVLAIMALGAGSAWASPPSATASSYREVQGGAMASWTTCPEQPREPTMCIETTLLADEVHRDGQADPFLVFDQVSFMVDVDGPPELVSRLQASGPMHLHRDAAMRGVQVSAELEGFLCEVTGWDEEYGIPVLDCDSAEMGHLEVAWTGTGAVERDRETFAPGHHGRDPIGVTHIGWSWRLADVVATRDGASFGSLVEARIFAARSSSTSVCRGGPSRTLVCEDDGSAG
jgi:hypothetical protein